MGEGLAGLAEDIARELVEQDDQPDLLLPRQRIEIPVDRGGERDVPAPGLADMGVGLVRAAKPDLGLFRIAVGRRLQLPEPVAVDVAEDGLEGGLLG